VDWIHLPRDGEELQAFLPMVMNFLCSIKGGKFFYPSPCSMKLDTGLINVLTLKITYKLIKPWQSTET
jgi:hypothetical protein